MEEVQDILGKGADAQRVVASLKWGLGHVMSANCYTVSLQPKNGSRSSFAIEDIPGYKITIVCNQGQLMTIALEVEDGVKLEIGFSQNMHRQNEVVVLFCGHALHQYRQWLLIKPVRAHVNTLITDLEPQLKQ